VKLSLSHAAGTADADAFIGLNARAIAFDHLDVDDHVSPGPNSGISLPADNFSNLLFFEL